MSHQDKSLKNKTQNWKSRAKEETKERRKDRNVETRAIESNDQFILEIEDIYNSETDPEKQKNKIEQYVLSYTTNMIKDINKKYAKKMNIAPPEEIDKLWNLNDAYKKFVFNEFQNLTKNLTVDEFAKTQLYIFVLEKLIQKLQESQNIVEQLNTTKRVLELNLRDRSTLYFIEAFLQKFEHFSDSDFNIQNFGKYLQTLKLNETELEIAKEIETNPQKYEFLKNKISALNFIKDFIIRLIFPISEESTLAEIIRTNFNKLQVLQDITNEQITALEEIIKKLQNELKQKDKNTDQVQLKLTECEKKLTSLQKIALEDAGKTQELISQKENLEQLIIKNTKELEIYKNQITSLLELEQQQTKFIQNLQSDFASEKIQQKQTYDQLTNLYISKFNKQEEELSQMRSLFDKLNGDVSQKQSEYDDLFLKYNNLVKQQMEDKNKCEQMETENAICVSDKNLLKQLENSLQKKFEEYNNLLAELQTTQQQYETKLEENAALLSTITKLETEHEELHKQFLKQQEQNRRESEALIYREEEIEDLQQKLRKEQTKYQILEQSKLEVDRVLESIRSQKSQVKKLNKVIEKDIPPKYKIQIYRQNQEIEELKDQLIKHDDVQEQKIQTLKLQIQKLKEEQKNISNEETVAITSLVTRNKILTDQNEKLLSQINETKNITNLETENQKLINGEKTIRRLLHIIQIFEKQGVQMPPNFADVPLEHIEEYAEYLNYILEILDKVVFASVKNYDNIFKAVFSSLEKRNTIYKKIQVCIRDPKCKLEKYLIDLYTEDQRLAAQVHKKLDDFEIPTNDKELEEVDMEIDAGEIQNQPQIILNSGNVQKPSFREPGSGYIKNGDLTAKGYQVLVSHRKFIKKFGDYELEKITETEFANIVKEVLRTNKAKQSYLTTILTSIRRVNPNFSYRAKDFNISRFQNVRLLNIKMKESLENIAEKAFAFLKSGFNAILPLTQMDSFLAIVLVMLTELRSNEIMNLKMSNLEEISTGNRVNLKIKRKLYLNSVNVPQPLYNNTLSHIKLYINNRNEYIRETGLDNRTDFVISISLSNINKFIRDQIVFIIKDSSFNSFGLMIFRKLAFTEYINNINAEVSRIMNRHATKKVGEDHYMLAMKDDAALNKLLG